MIVRCCAVLVGVLFLSCWNIAQSRADDLPSGCITLVDWMTNITVQEQLGIDNQQLDEIRDVFVVIASDLKEFCDLNPLPRHEDRNFDNFDEIEETIAEVNRFRINVMTHAERQIFEILSDSQDEKLLGRLIESAGYHSLLESPELRQRVKLTDEQLIKLDHLYRNPYRRAYKILWNADKGKDLNSQEDIRKHGHEFSLYRTQMLEETVWGLIDEIKAQEETSEERALQLLTVEQAAIIKQLKSKAPKKPKEDS